MARKPILEGGKRDEILECATRLFLENGYEKTSVRMILNEVGGEVGMFYHYFNSKQELFDKVFEHFMKQQSEEITRILTAISDEIVPYQKIEQIMSCYLQSMDKYKKLANGTIHWSILSTLHDLTVYSMCPAVKTMIISIYTKVGIDDFSEIDWITPYLLKGISGLLHDKKFSILPLEQQKSLIIELICRTLKISPNGLKQ